MAVKVEAFIISNVSVTPLTKRDFIKGQHKDIFITNIKYKDEPFKLQVNDIILNKYCIAPFINPKTEIPHSKYIRSEDDPKRYCISVPVNYKLQIVLDYINEYKENNLGQIITYTDRQKVFFKSYKPEFICASGHKKVLL